MPSPLSLEAIVSRLEAQLEFHREKESFHAQQEEHHREQRAVHAAELEKVRSSLDVFKAAATTAVELAQRDVPHPAAPQPPTPSQDVGRRPSLTKMVKRILEIRPAGDVFGTNAITRELLRHYGDKLGGRVDVKQVAIILRRLQQSGSLRQVREGRPHHETLYSKA
jgi:hypothetical protein